MNLVPCPMPAPYLWTTGLDSEGIPSARLENAVRDHLGLGAL